MDRSSAVNQIRTIADQLRADDTDDAQKRDAVEHLDAAIEALEQPDVPTPQELREAKREAVRTGSIPGEPEDTAKARKDG